MNHFPWYGRSDAVLAELESFVLDVRGEEARLDRVLATVLFTDIVGSTQKAAELGDGAWKDFSIDITQPFER